MLVTKEVSSYTYEGDKISLEEFLKIVDFLCSNNVQPLKEINRLYDELRTVIYITHQ